MTQKKTLSVRDILVAMVKDIRRKFFTWPNLFAMFRDYFALIFVTVGFALICIGYAEQSETAQAISFGVVAIAAIFAIVVGAVHFTQLGNQRLKESLARADERMANQGSTSTQPTRPYCSCRRIECHYCNDDNW